MDKTEFHRMPHNRSCQACRFFDSVTNMVNAQTTQICRFNAPVPFAAAAMTPNGPAWMATTLWPQVSASDWCHNFEPEVTN